MFKNKSKTQNNTLYNINMLYKSKKAVTEYFDCQSSLTSQGKHKAFEGKLIKLLAP